MARSRDRVVATNRWGTVSGEGSAGYGTVKSTLHPAGRRRRRDRSRDLPLPWDGQAGAGKSNGKEQAVSGAGPETTHCWLKRYESAKVSMIGATGGFASVLLLVTNRQLT